MTFRINSFVSVGVALIMAVGIYGASTLAHAETNNLSQSEQIQKLLLIIQQLQAQIAALKGGEGVSECVQLSRTLFVGTSDGETGGEVSKLQKFLKNTGHYTYSEITGFFGPATEQAVKAWQKANGLVTSGSPETTGFGLVGPSTRAAMGKLCSSIVSERPEERLPGVKPETELHVSISSISNSENPVVKGTAFGTTVVGFAVAAPSGDKAYGSGDISVENNVWSHKIHEDLADGIYSLTVYVDNKEVAKKKFVVGSDTAEGSASTEGENSVMNAEYEITAGEDMYDAGKASEAEAHTRCATAVNATVLVPITCSWDGKLFFSGTNPKG